MDDIRAALTEACRQNDILLSPEQAGQFQIYFEKLLDWNHKINLTSITEPVKIVEKHFLDSLMLLQVVQFKPGASLVDVGTGAGFPGVPLKIMRPDLKLTLMDSLQKRITFLDFLCDALPIEAETVHIRAEEAGRDPVYRESFDFATARAVAGLGVLAEYCLPLVKKGGFFLAMKGPSLDEELAGAKNAIRLLGGMIQKVEAFSLPGGDERRLVMVRKTERTAAVYPRHGGTIAKKPL